MSSGACREQRRNGRPAHIPKRGPPPHPSKSSTRRGCTLPCALQKKGGNRSVRLSPCCFGIIQRSRPGVCPDREGQYSRPAVSEKARPAHLCPPCYACTPKKRPKEPSGSFGKTSADGPLLPHGLGEKSGAGRDSGGDSEVNSKANLGSARQVNSVSSPEVGAGPMRMTRQESGPAGQLSARQANSAPGPEATLGLARGLFSVRPGNWPGIRPGGPAGALRFSSRRPNRPHRRCPARCRRAR